MNESPVCYSSLRGTIITTRTTQDLRVDHIGTEKVYCVKAEQPTLNYHMLEVDVREEQINSISLILLNLKVRGSFVSV